MPIFIVNLADSTSDTLKADCYKQEGTLTTFFQYGPQRDMIDSWSQRLASYKTSEIIAIRRSCDVSEQQLLAIA